MENYVPKDGHPSSNPLVVVERSRHEGYSIESKKFVFSVEKENSDSKNHHDGVEILKRKRGRPQHSSGNTNPFKKARTKMIDCFKSL